jgi:hypothetical protein
MQPKREFDAEDAAQDVVNACAIALQGGSVPAVIKEEAERERTTKREFLDAYRVFYETREPDR